MEWNSNTIAEIFRPLKVSPFTRDELNYSGGNFRNVHYGDILVKFPSVIDVEKEGLPYVNDASEPKCGRCSLLQDGDVIIADTAEDEAVGKAIEIQGTTGQKVVSGLHTIAYRPQEGIFAPGFLGYFLNSSVYHNQLLPLMQGIKVLSLSRSALADTVINYPSYAEQERIADALSSIDALIAGLDEAIEKKRQIKEGLMQNLLTGSIRLRGFSGEWQNKTVGEIGFTYSGLTGKGKNDFGHGEALYITFLNVLNNPILKTDIFEKVDVKDGERQNKALKGDLFFNTSSETPEEVGICAMLNEGIENLYLNSFCFGFRLTDPEVDGLYLSYFWRSKLGREIMTTLAQGATRYNLSKEYFNKTKILLPPLNLQRHIANTLMIAEREIALLEAKREKYNLIKQGMMQELLTGKTRLI